jgi:hypothetical protein
MQRKIKKKFFLKGEERLYKKISSSGLKIGSIRKLEKISFSSASLSALSTEC